MARRMGDGSVVGSPDPQLHGVKELLFSCSPLLPAAQTKPAEVRLCSVLTPTGVRDGVCFSSITRRFSDGQKVSLRQKGKGVSFAASRDLDCSARERGSVHVSTSSGWGGIVVCGGATALAHPPLSCIPVTVCCRYTTMQHWTAPRCLPTDIVCTARQPPAHA